MFPARRADPDSLFSAPREQPARGLAALAAAAATAAATVQLILAPVTVALTVLLVLAGRVGRWRTGWLAWPALLGAAMTTVRGAVAAVTGYLAAARTMAGLAGSGHLAAGAGLDLALASWRHWVPDQLPVALIVASAEAGMIFRFGGVLGIAGPQPPLRPGALAATRRAYLTVVLRRGEVATGDGGCVGVIRETGRRAAVSWPEAQHGVLLAGSDAAGVTATGLELATAAIQHRKTVIIVDLLGGGRILPARIAAACARGQAPLLQLGRSRPYYDPFAGQSPDRAANLAMAMIDWAGADQAGRELCAGYVRTAMAFIATDDSAAVQVRRSVIGELAGLLRPGVLAARLDRAAAARADLDALRRRAGELGRRLDAEPAGAAAVAAAAGQLAELASSDTGAQLRPPEPGDPRISLGRALAEREVVLCCAGSGAPGRPVTMVGRLVVADLTGLLAERGDIGAPADCLTWIHGCEAIEVSQLAALTALGPATGTAVLLSTTSSAAAAALADRVTVIAVRGLPPEGLTAWAPDDADFRSVSITVRGPQPRQIRCEATCRGGEGGP